MRWVRPPHAPHLKPLYLQAQALFSSLFITDWVHHYRSNNKMADKAVNVAMDSGLTWQGSPSPVHPSFHAITALLHHDIGPWVELLANGPERDPGGAVGL
jgi:hypothetical protein